MLSPEELHRYSRQVLLPAFGKEGQERLKRSRVLVIGAGGLGTPVLQYLAAAGVGKMGIVDFDRVDVSNLQRQVLFATSDVGKHKATIAGEKIRAINPLIQTEVFIERISSSNAKEILRDYDVVVDGSDNLPTRYLVNDACVLLNKPLVYGAIFQFEGQVSVFNQLLEDGTRGPNYRDLFPEPPPPEMVPSCAEGGVLGVLPGIIGSMQANEAIKILAQIGTTLQGRLLLFNSLDFTSRIVNIRRNPFNPLNGKTPTIFDLIDYEQFCNPSAHKSNIAEINPETLQAWLRSGKELQIIDVREATEVSIVRLESVHIPVRDIVANLAAIRRDIPVVIYCKSGGRSSTVVRTLQSDHGFQNLHNLTGGIIGWINQVEPTLPRY